MQATSLTGDLTLLERAQQGNRHQHPGSGVAKGRSRLNRRTARLAVTHRATSRLCNHVESETIFVRAAFAKAFDLAKMIPGLSSRTAS